MPSQGVLPVSRHPERGSKSQLWVIRHPKVTGSNKFVIVTMKLSPQSHSVTLLLSPSSIASSYNLDNKVSSTATADKANTSALITEIKLPEQPQT
jgi:hypothetical protein